jgi:hypothetical protein
VKYITFLSREVWPPFNSLYAYTRIRGKFPGEIVILHSGGGEIERLERMIEILYRANNREAKIRKIRIGDEIGNMMEKLKTIVEEGDIVDITGARKSMIIGLMDIRGIKIIYLLLRDMRFSSYPFPMRPLSLQSLMEVER